jgi:NADH:ubiquinone oxidoreductase subunit 3 (subunit A)
MRELNIDFLTEFYIQFHGCSSILKYIISQQLFSVYNFEEDYLHFLEQYYRVLLFFKKTFEIFPTMQYFYPFTESDFKEAVFFFLMDTPDLYNIFIYSGDIIFMQSSLIETSIWVHEIFFGVPLLYIFIKSSITISFLSITTFPISILFKIYTYFVFLYQLFNFLPSTSEYFFISIGLFINFLIAFLLLCLIYVINRGTVISDLEKTSAYECGFDPFKDSRQLMDINFFRVAILFILFDLEIIYLIPWIYILYASFYNYYIVMGGFCYLFILSLGLFFEYKSKMLDW